MTSFWIIDRNGECMCLWGYYGQSCNKRCDDNENCSGHGVCIAEGKKTRNEWIDFSWFNMTNYLSFDWIQLLIDWLNEWMNDMIWYERDCICQHLFN